MLGPYYLPYGQSATIIFPLYEADGVTPYTGPAPISGDTLINRDAAANQSSSNQPISRLNGLWSLVLTGAELTGRDTTVLIEDKSATDTWLPTSVKIFTVGGPSAFQQFDIFDENPPVSIVAGGLEGISLGAGLEHLSYVGDHGPGVYLDTVGGSAGVTIGVHGTPGNPSGSLANARTIADSLGISRIYILNGSSVTLDQAYDDYHLIGIGANNVNSLDINNASISGSVIQNLLVIGRQGASVSRPDFIGCVIRGMQQLNTRAIGCELDGVLQLTAATDHVFYGCSPVPASGAYPSIDLSNNSDVDILEHDGLLELRGGTSLNDVFVTGHGFLRISNSNNLTVKLAGAWEEDDQGTNTTISAEGSFNRLLGGAGNVTAIDGVALVPHQPGVMPSEIVVGGGNDDSVPFVVTSVGFVPTVTQFKITTTPFPDDIPIGRSILFDDVGSQLNGHATVCLAWDSVNQIVTVREMPAAPADGDEGKWI